MTVERQLQTYAAKIDRRLDRLLPDASTYPEVLCEAMRYACLAPGKRLRPALCLAACEAAGGEMDKAVDMACAIEMVHSFSLIHDDLPALDNDDLRRGRATCHVQFGEAMAILAGDGLFSLAFETASHAPGTSESRILCLQALSKATGMNGLVAGEAADILSEGKPLDLHLLDFIHSHKTGALIRASCEIGAVVAEGGIEPIEKLRAYGGAVGLAFQIADDVLDETSTREQLGKSAGADREKQKATYPRLLGLDQSVSRSEELASEAQRHLEGLPGPTGFLAEIASYAVRRQK